MTEPEEVSDETVAATDRQEEEEWQSYTAMLQDVSQLELQLNLQRERDNDQRATRAQWIANPETQPASAKNQLDSTMIIIRKLCRLLKNAYMEAYELVGAVTKDTEDTTASTDAKDCTCPEGEICSHFLGRAKDNDSIRALWMEHKRAQGGQNH